MTDKKRTGNKMNNGGTGSPNTFGNDKVPGGKPKPPKPPKPPQK